jgi:hypothetical protein
MNHRCVKLPNDQIVLGEPTDRRLVPTRHCSIGAIDQGPTSRLDRRGGSRVVACGAQLAAPELQAVDAPALQAKS